MKTFTLIIAALVLAASCAAPIGLGSAGDARALGDYPLELSIDQAVPLATQDINGVWTTPLIAGQNFDAGRVEWRLISGTDAAGRPTWSVEATIITTGEWTMGKAHFGIWTRDQFLALWNPTLTAEGSIVNFRLIPGQFPYHSPALDPLSTREYRFRVDVTPLLAAANLVPGQNWLGLYAAVHAEVHRVVDGSIVQSETAWGGGFQNQKGNWAMYTVLTIKATDAVPPPPEVVINYAGAETAFAWGQSSARDFRSDGFSRWGWTNFVPTGASYSFPLLAGAGQSDVTKGKPVGMVNVRNTGTRLEVIVIMDRTDLTWQAGDRSGSVTAVPYRIQALHAYADSLPYPMAKSGKTSAPTVAPGQYPFIKVFDSALSGIGRAYVDSHSFSLPVKGDAWFIFHGVAMFPEAMLVQ